MPKAYPKICMDDDDVPLVHKQTWTENTNCCHCGDEIGTQLSYHVPLCNACRDNALILSQYKVSE